MPEAQNPLPEKPSGPRSGLESYSNGGFWASGNFGKDEFLNHTPDYGTISEYSEKLYTLRESRRGPWRPEAQRFVVNGPNAAQWGPECPRGVQELLCWSQHGMGWNEIDYSKFMSDPPTQEPQGLQDYSWRIPKSRSRTSSRAKMHTKNA